jgi:hypothetical protein
MPNVDEEYVQDDDNPETSNQTSQPPSPIQRKDSSSPQQEYRRAPPTRSQTMEVGSSQRFNDRNYIPEDDEYVVNNAKPPANQLDNAPAYGRAGNIERSDTVTSTGSVVAAMRNRYATNVREVRCVSSVLRRSLMFV